MKKHEKSIQDAYTLLIQSVVNEMGYNSEEDIQNMTDSPKRCAKGFLEIIKPLKDIQKGVREIMSKAFDSTYNGMVVGQNIIAFSMCPHHFLPVVYRATVAYIPEENSQVIGISKLARLCSLLASRPVLQETLCTDIAETLAINHAPEHKFKGLRSAGSACTLEAIHFCMAARGVRLHESRVITQNLLGAFFDNADTRAEFVALVNSNRPERLL